MLRKTIIVCILFVSLSCKVVDKNNEMIDDSIIRILIEKLGDQNRKKDLVNRNINTSIMTYLKNNVNNISVRVLRENLKNVNDIYTGEGGEDLNIQLFCDKLLDLKEQRKDLLK